MALVNQTLKLEITPGGVPPKLHVTEYDENMQVVAQLFQRGQYYEIPSGTTAKVEGTLAGHPFSADATVDGSNVTFELTKSMTAYAGRAWTKIKLTKDGKSVSTCGFWLECDRAGVDAGDVIGAPWFEEQINALDGMFKVCAFIKDDVSAEYTAFKTAFGIADSGGGDEEPDEPVTPDVTLTSISATYSGGDVAVGTAVADLTGIVVTAHYSDGTSKAVTGYTLDGTIAEGENTVTVIYGGKMTEFVVVGVAESGGEVVMLKSITGDGASYIDTGIAPESLFSTYGVDISVEMSAKIPNYTEPINFFGANQSKLYGSYGAFCATSEFMYCRGTDENNVINSQDSNGFWNSTAVPNLYTEQRWYKYATTPDGTLSAIYMDESMSTLPSSADANFTAFANYNETALRASVPIIPMYIFAVNVGDGANQVITDGTPTVYTLYYFRIKRYSTGELLHEYLPAKQGDKIGMYDTVTQTFHENQGTGTFSYEEVSA